MVVNKHCIVLQREGLSKFNKIYEFESNLFNQNATMTMTSVSGHLLNFEFAMNFRSWNSCNPVVLFDAPIFKSCSKDYEPIKVFKTCCKMCTCN